MDLVSLAISVLALLISGAAYLQARKTGSLGHRREAINLVRSALSDVKLHAHIDDKTTASLREAYQISALVFSKKVSDTLGELHALSFQLANKRLEQKTEKDLDAEKLLGTALEKVLASMQSEAALSTWGF